MMCTSTESHGTSAAVAMALTMVSTRAVEYSAAVSADLNTRTTPNPQGECAGTRPGGVSGGGRERGCNSDPECEPVADKGEGGRGAGGELGGGGGGGLSEHASARRSS
eukprot:scaffold162168_cov25-Tisochrysis_lutea.AAC.2